jgi:hypothetical protein
LEREDDKDEDNRSDYYFSLPSIIAPVSAFEFFTAMG